MNDVFHYKGYYASIHFSAQENIFFGKIQGIEEVVLFNARSLKDLKTAFLEAVETYIDGLENPHQKNTLKNDYPDINNTI
jgi:predicted HicB family RNase H-like nuclease